MRHARLMPRTRAAYVMEAHPTIPQHHAHRIRRAMRTPYRLAKVSGDEWVMSSMKGWCCGMSTHIYEALLPWFSILQIKDFISALFADSNAYAYYLCTSLNKKSCSSNSMCAYNIYGGGSTQSTYDRLAKAYVTLIGAKSKLICWAACDKWGIAFTYVWHARYLFARQGGGHKDWRIR